MKKLGILFTAALLSLSLLLLAACGGDGKQAGKDEFLGLKDGEEFVTDHLVNVSFIRPAGNTAQENWWKKRVDAFNAAYEGRIRVTAEVLVRGDSSSYEQQIGLRVDEGLPDVMYVDGPYVSNWAYNGMLVPIDNYITETYRADFMDYIIDQGTYDERLYALSIVDSTVMVFYRKSLMEAFLKTKPRFDDGTEIKIPANVDEAWTWDQLAQIAAKMKKSVGGKTQYGLSIAGDKTEWMSYAFSPMWGGNILGADGLTAEGNLNSAAGYAAGNYLRSLVDKKAINPAASGMDFYADGSNASTSGGSPCLAAMYFTGTQNITKFNEFDNVAADWDATYYPRGNDNSYSVPCGGWTLGLTSDCAVEKRVAAVEFIKFLTSSESCESFARDTASPPARKSLYASMAEYADGSTVQSGAYVRIKEQIFKAAEPRTKTVAYAEFSPLLAKALNEIVSQTAPNVRDKLDQAAKTIDNKIRQASYK